MEGLAIGATPKAATAGEAEEAGALSAEWRKARPQQRRSRCCGNLLIKLKNTDSFQEDDEKKDWCNELNHYDVKCLAGKLFTIEGNLIDCSLRLSNPANENTGKKTNDRHKDVVTCVVEDVENLTDTTVRKFEVEIEYVVSKTNNN